MIHGQLAVGAGRTKWPEPYRLGHWFITLHDRFIQIFLKSHEHLVYLFRPAQVCNRVGDGIAITQAEQRREFFLIEFIHPTPT